jgi:hypothetical protein
MGAWAPVSDNFVTVPGAPVTAVPWGSRFALFATDSNGVVYTAAGDPQGLLGPWAILSTVTFIQFTGPVTVKIDHPNFDPAKFKPKPAPFTLSILDETFPETRQVQISDFPDVVLGDGGFGVGKVTAQYRSAGAGSFPSNGAMTISDVVFNIHFEHIEDSLATFSLSTGTAVSPMGKLPTVSGQPADNDGAIVLVGAGALMGGHEELKNRDFTVSFNGVISPRPA